MARAPRVCKESSASRYGSVNAGSLAKSPNSSRFLTKASGSSRCWAAIRCKVSASSIDYLDGLTLLVDAFGIAGPTGDHRRRKRDISIGGKILANHRQQPLGNAIRTLRTEPGDGVSDRVIGESFDQLQLVRVQIDARHRGQGGRGFSVHIVQQEVGKQRILRDLMHQAVAREIAEVAQRLMAGIQQPQLHQLIRHHVRDDLHPNVLQAAGDRRRSCPPAPTA